VDINFFKMERLLVFLQHQINVEAATPERDVRLMDNHNFDFDHRLEDILDFDMHLSMRLPEGSVDIIK